MNTIARFIGSEDGATAVEYAVMLALILLACLAGITLVGDQTGANFTDSSDKIEAAFK